MGLPGAGVKPPFPFPRRTVTLQSALLAMTRSSKPSPLKSPTATVTGVEPTVNGQPGALVNPPAPLPSSTCTSVLDQSVIATSGMPSPLKSPTAAESGHTPAPYGLP